MKRIVRFFLTAAILVCSNSAIANTELNSVFDARSVGMGGTGVALVENGAASFHNPANLAGTKFLDVTLAFTPVFPQMNVPMMDLAGMTAPPPEIVQVESDRQMGPLGLLGLGLRVHDKVVLGLTGFLSVGAGAAYTESGMWVDATGTALDASVAAMAGELQVPVAFQLNDALSLGVAYRLAFAQMITKVPTSATGMPPHSETELSQSGVNPLGVQVGVLYKPNSSFSCGATYRSKSAIEVKGDLKDGEGNVLMTADEMEEAGTHTYFSMPHMLKVGTAFKPVGEELTLAADFRYLMFSDSHTPRRAGAGSQWRDAVDLSVGAEYVLSSMFPVRLGMMLGQSATTKGAGGMLLFLPSPAVNIGLFLGGGVKLSTVDIDLAVGYIFGKTSIDENKTDLPGDYSYNMPIASLSATLHM